MTIPGEEKRVTTYENNRAMMLRATKGNSDAADFIQLICEILHFWDDLIDKDRLLTSDIINASMWKALVVLPRNNFYRTYFAELNPTLMVAIQNWMAANVMERGEDDDDLIIAFIIRSSYVDIVSQVALICGGFEWAGLITLEARRLWHDETYNGYRINLENQKKDAAALKCSEKDVNHVL